MIPVRFKKPTDSPLRILCLGAHSDDIEIGCGGTILHLADSYPDCEIYWVVFSGAGVREAEARSAAQSFADRRLRSLILKSFSDGFMPYNGSDVKAVFENELKVITPDVVFTHNSADAHQDHRLISELTWNTFRNNLILEYEIPKYDGDLGRPSVFVELRREVCEAKVRNIMEAFVSQHQKHWFRAETFFSLMRLRGMECASESDFAEAFYCRKLVIN
jgi:LmbE family N-acetylglucosaminyl deacetylase